jgi:uncharacterized membrane protein YqgA involved in biofilm formation
MLGTIVNALAIIGGSITGYVLRGGIPERVNETLMKGLGLCVLIIGIQNALVSNSLLLIIFSIVIGALIGEAVDIDKQLQKLGNYIESKLRGRGGKVSEGFVTTSLIYCVGAMAVTGSLESGLMGNHKTLFAKSIIDGISAIVFTTSMGIGVMFSAVSVFIYQGTITIAASLLKQILTATAVNDMMSVGGLLIIGISLNMMGITKIKVANLLPSIFIPLVYHFALTLI